MIFGSVCSGIEAASVAWNPLGWETAWLAEIEAFPCAVLSHRHPTVPNLGDMTRIHRRRRFREGAIDILVGGTPCQSFSVAGLRKGLADPRGNLALVYLGIADRARPRWVVWENVPGVLSSAGGRDFGSFLGALGQLGYGWAYRVLDAQNFGVPQRRRRVFVVGHLGDWRPAVAVLFERHSLSGHPPPRREPGKGTAHPVAPGLRSGGPGCARTGDSRGQDPVVAVPFGGNDTRGPIDVSTACNAKGGSGRMDFESETLIAGTLAASGAGTERPAGQGNELDFCIPVAHSLRGEGHDASEDGTGRGTPLVAHSLRRNPGSGNAHNTTFAVQDPEGEAVAFSCKDHGSDADALSPTLRAMGHDGSHPNAGGQVAVVFQQNSRSEVRSLGDRTGAVTSGPGAQCQNYVAFQGGSQQDQFVPPGSVVPTLAHSSNRHGGHHQPKLWGASAVRRLTPRECERLQGFPDDYTLVPHRGKLAADGPRYKALGNSMAVPVMRWIGERIAMVEAL